jgi:hypothetical protein
MQKFSIIYPQQLHNNDKYNNNNYNYNNYSDNNDDDGDNYDKPLLCYIVRPFFIPPISVLWWLSTSQTGASVTD